MDLSLRYTYMSPAVTRMRGYSVEEIVGTSVGEAMTPASLEVARKTLAEQLVLERGEGADPNRSAKLDLEMFCKDGSTIWTEMNMTFLRGADGRPVGILGVTRDITERKRAEEALRDSESRVSIILESVRTAIVMIDRETHTITDANSAAVGLIGAPKEEIIGSACHRYICPADEGRCPITDLGQTVDNSERVLLTAEGERAPIIKSVVTVDIGGRKHLLESFTDMSERKRTEQALEESERRYRLITENATDLIWTTDMSLRYTYISPSVLRLRGYSVEEAMAHTVQEDLCPSSLDVAMKALAEEVARPVDEKAPYRWRTLELEHFCKDGSTIWLEVTTTFLMDEDGRRVGLLGSSRDISERRRRRRHCENRRRSTGVSYRTPLKG